MDYINAVHMIFEKHFTDTYRQSNHKHRTKLLPYISTIYRRWYYAALVEDTLLTPANLVESINHAYDKQPDLSPAIRLRSERKFCGFLVHMNEYAPQTHPVSADFRTLVEYCRPDIDLNEEDGFYFSQAGELAGKLSLWDPHYASYLLSLAMAMDLIIKIPSIYANRVQVARDYEARLAVTDEALFGEIVEATIKMTSQILRDMIPLPEPVFDEGFIRALLKKPMGTDDIFQRVYDLMGITLEDMFDIDVDDEYDGLDAAFLSSTYMMGIALDKYFFTPFSYYLKLIRPLYALPFEFENEIRYFLDSGFDEEELYTAFFAPCSRYYFTDLGLAYFNIKPTAQNYLDVRNRLSFDQLREQLFQKKNLSEALPVHMHLDEPGGAEGSLIYTLKIKSKPEPTQWLEMDMAADTTLHRLYLETAARFNLNRNGDYSFFHDETENPFAEYASPKNARRAKKTADIPLDSLDFEHMQTLILVVYNQSDPILSGFSGEPNRATIRLRIDRVDTKPREPGRAYPIVTRMSRELKGMNGKE